METISEQEIYFLTSLNASEEGSLIELRCELAKWDIGTIDVSKIIESLIEQDIILIRERTIEGFSDYSKSESVEISKTWDSCESHETMMFLTEQGENRWETDDWGITTKRVKHLMFSNPGKVTRVE